MSYFASILDGDVLIPRGDVPGWSGLNKFGRNDDVDTAAAEDIWDGDTAVWAAPTAPVVHNITSTSTNDAAAGTGARTVKVFGLDSSWRLQDEVVTMNGTSDVPTTKAYWRIFRMFTVTAGSGGANAGTVTATAIAPSATTVTAQVEIGNNQTLMAVYTVPADKTLFISCYYAGVNKSSGLTASVDMRLLVRENAQTSDTVYQVKHHLAVHSGLEPYRHCFKPYLKITEMSDVKMQATTSANNADVSAGFDGYIVNNSGSLD